MTRDGKPITGRCPHCGRLTVHRCISPLAGLYQCRACGKTHETGEISVAERPTAPHTTQKELFA